MDLLIAHWAPDGNEWAWGGACRLDGAAPKAFQPARRSGACPVVLGRRAPLV
ncbi:hypothetical protein SZ55_2898 [Pseudomonas sp. FeS53a]|nr:hypothetical protein SZ55_2898 [Pseudomonas sp. FeS53a]